MNALLETTASVSLSQSRIKQKIWRNFAYSIMIAYGILCLLPFMWALFVALAPLTYVPAGGVEPVGVDTMKWPPQINLFKGIVFGAPITINNFIEIFRIVPYLSRWFVNTVLFSAFTSFGVVALGTLAAYAFARLKFPFRDVLFALLLATMMLPFSVTMIPVYNLLVRFGWVNTYKGLMIPRLFSVSIIFFMRQFFLDFPISLEEAAFIDGASIPRIFMRIVLPNSHPAIAAQFIYIFLGAWNEFMWPLIVTSKVEMYTLTMGLNFFRTSYYTFWQYLMAASLLVTIPMVIIFLIFQRQFIQSNVASAVKG